MRRLLAWFPQDSDTDPAVAAHGAGATNVIELPGRSGEGEVRLFVVEAENQAMEEVIRSLSELRHAHLSLAPQGVLSLRPPADEPADQVTDVTLRSPIEIFLGGLQSVGSIRGFLAYAAAAGGVVWTGLYTNTVFLLTAAMLIAPFAGPAMNAALATARGDAVLLRRSAGRYLLALAVTAAVSCLLSLAFRIEAMTELMAQTASLSFAAILIPLLAGAAGAVNLVQSERSSLVSGAATGLLVAAALAPPAGSLGIAVALGSGALAKAALFQLGLQLIGINLAGAAVFVLAGVRPSGARFPAGKSAVQRASFAGSALLFAAFMAWQVVDQPDLTRSTVSQRALAVVQQELRTSELAELVTVDTRFASGGELAQNRLVVDVQVLPRTSGDVAGPLADQLLPALTAEFPGVTPLLDVKALRGAPARSG